jgi:Gram-negative bacterial TonB protein C-terminal
LKAGLVPACHVLQYLRISGSRPVRVLLACALFGSAVCRPAVAQQPTQAPPFRVPDPIHLNFPALSKTDSTSPEIEHLPDLAARLLHHAADAGCHEDNYDCTILVTDFVFPVGASLFANEKSILVVDRVQFKEPPSLPPFPDTVNGEKVYPAGVNGVGLPSCYYMPNPSYTVAAREAGFSGMVTAEGVVGSDGLVRAIRIVKGAPFGMDEAVIKTIGTWKCKPAVLDGKPVATFVPFETNFRLFGPN